MPLPTHATAQAVAVLQSLGRTEDVRFSPSNRRLAVAGFRRNVIALFDVAMTSNSAPRSVSLSNAIEMTSDSLCEPHGIDFIDENTLVVANRRRQVSVLGLPPVGTTLPSFRAADIAVLEGAPSCPVTTPGSVCVTFPSAKGVEILVCNNYVHYVSRHALDAGSGFRATSNEVLLADGLSVPDGVSASRDGRWIAISNHDAHCVFLYENRPDLDRTTPPDGILRNLRFPHGVRFAADGNFILVADAGNPHLNVYARGESDWRGVRDPLHLVQVLDQPVFKAGRHNPREGGPKGIDVSDNLGVVVVTTHEQPLAFFDLQTVLSSGTQPVNRHVQSVSTLVELSAYDFIEKVRRKLGRSMTEAEKAVTDLRRPSNPPSISAA
jgi:DNA-binding beta-propeller fold protein YncE